MMGYHICRIGGESLEQECRQQRYQCSDLDLPCFHFMSHKLGGSPHHQPGYEYGNNDEDEKEEEEEEGEEEEEDDEEDEDEEDEEDEDDDDDEEEDEDDVPVQAKDHESLL